MLLIILCPGSGGRAAEQDRDPEAREGDHLQAADGVHQDGERAGVPPGAGAGAASRAGPEVPRLEETTKLRTGQGEEDSKISCKI